MFNFVVFFFFFKQKTAYEMRISDWSSDVCSSDLRDYVVVLSDWHDTRPEKILANLKKQSDYYNYNQRTLLSFFDEAAEKGFNAALADRMDWGDMRMAPTDVADIRGYTFLVNGKKIERGTWREGVCADV